jgi:hypothetical protein
VAKLSETQVKYSLSDIKAAFASFEATDAFSVLKNGKWEHAPMIFGMVQPRAEGTACKVGKLSKVMDFPEYLEKHFEKVA